MRYSQHSIMPQRATARLHTLSISDPLPQGQNVIFFRKTKSKPNAKNADLVTQTVRISVVFLSAAS